MNASRDVVWCLATFFFRLEANGSESASSLRLSKMAASSSSQPQHVTLQSDPDTHPKIGKKTSSRKGKGKENTSRAGQRSQGHISADGDKESEESGAPWDWASLTDPSASKAPPIYTKDGR